VCECVHVSVSLCLAKDLLGIQCHTYLCKISAVTVHRASVCKGTKVNTEVPNTSPNITCVCVRVCMCVCECVSVCTCVCKCVRVL
jgi:hypothetical protein